VRNMEEITRQWNGFTRTLIDLWTNKHRLATQVLNLGMIVFSALMIWKGMIAYTGSISPVVVVLSGSMEPAFFRGDILFLAMPDRSIETGDIVVYSVKGRDIPIVHRVLEVHRPHIDNEDDEEVRLLTKGDNNPVDDRGLYQPGHKWLRESEILGVVRACVPYVGMFTILLNDYPTLKYVILGGMGLFVLLNREE